MTRPLIPPRGVFVPSKIIFDLELLAPVRDTAVQIIALAWGKNETPPVSFQELATLTGKSIPTLYVHMGVLRDKGALRWRTSGTATIIVELLDGMKEPEDSSQLELLDPSSISLIKSTKKNIKNTNSSVLESAPKPRDAMFDAIVAITKIDPSIKSAAASVGKVKRELLQAQPPYTPDEIIAFGAWWSSDDWRRKNGPPACHQITQKIGVMRNGNGNGNGAGHAITRRDSSDDEATRECAARINARNGK
jgi:hypothetical protein